MIILSSFRFSYGHFPTTEIKADYLFDTFGKPFDIYWIARSARGSCHVRRIIKIFYQMSNFAEGCNSPNLPVQKTVNLYSDNRLPLYFICDVQHLIKTTRNCWSHSFPRSRRRAMWVSTNAWYKCMARQKDHFCVCICSLMIKEYRGRTWQSYIESIENFWCSRTLFRQEKLNMEQIWQDGF